MFRDLSFAGILRCHSNTLVAMITAILFRLRLSLKASLEPSES